MKNFGTFEGVPCQWTDDEAWVYWHGAWQRWNEIEVMNDADWWDELSVRRKYGRLPPLPREAFRET
jgi:hypothetical protein